MPILMAVKYAWQDPQKSFPFNDKIKSIFTDGGLIKLSVETFKNTGVKYDGPMNLDISNDYYLSIKGKEIGFVKDFETAVKLYG